MGPYRRVDAHNVIPLTPVKSCQLRPMTVKKFCLIDWVPIKNEKILLTPKSLTPYIQDNILKLK